MSDIERYDRLITAAMEAQQLKIELNNKLKEVANNLTAYELNHRTFCNESTQKAFAILPKELKLRKAAHVQSELAFKNTRISLHAKMDNLKGSAMKCILDELSNSEILKGE